MKLVVLDPGFEHAHAHHLTVNLSLGQRLAERGIETSVYAARTVDTEARQALESQGITVVPYFETPCYPPQAECPDNEEHDRLEADFSKEVIELYEAGRLSGREALIFHTGFSFHYAALARALWHLDPRPTGKILLLPMFNVGAHREHSSGALEVHNPRVYARHKVAFALLDRLRGSYRLDIHLASSCQEYVQALEMLWSGEAVSLHPSVCFRDRQLPESHTQGASEHRVLLYLGGAKVGKGIEFAAALGARLAPEFPDYRFVFHFNDRFPGADRFEQSVGALQHAGEQHGNVEILRGTLTDQDYDRLVGTSQIIMLLYDPDEYRHKTSGVFWDALQGGNKHWVVTQCTWVSRELRELGIECSTVPFGDLEASVPFLRTVLTELAGPPARLSSPPTNRWYAERLLRPLGDWVGDELLPAKRQFMPDGSRRLRPSILVVRTSYGHFGEFSGPGGFVPHLSAQGVDVHEIKVDLGDALLSAGDSETRYRFDQLATRYLRSYQQNSAVIEATIQHNIGRYDIIHFVDAEHTGLLSAQVRRKFSDMPSPALVATFHQPSDILQELIPDPAWLGAFDTIHMLAPDQSSFLGLHTDPGRLVCIPHGIAKGLLEENPGLASASELQGILPPSLEHKTLLLTVGNWLRDFDQLLTTARALESREDLAFVIVSRNLDLDFGDAGNVTLLNQGVTDAQLHALYRRAALLFLPLQSGAANNAVLESMAHGLPIVATDIPSISFYTEDLATRSPHDPEAYASHIERALAELGDSSRSEGLRSALNRRAASLCWDRIAHRMMTELYLPLLEGTRRGPEDQGVSLDPLARAMEQKA